MFRYQLLIEYLGTNYKGWQIQKKNKTIQGILQDKIRKLLKENITIVGSGRTDAGVHAIEQSAHFDLKNKLLNLDKFINSINHFLKKENIVILKIKKRSSNFHSRFSAKKRVYKYIILNRTSLPVIEKNRVWHVRKKLSINEMKKGAKLLTGTHDFSAYRSSSCTAKSPVRTIKKISIKKNRNGKIIIRFVSKSFLQKQVRSMVGCLKFLGEGKWDISKFKKSLISKKRSTCATPAPACGLYLEKVKY